MTSEPSPTPRQLLDRGLTREQARFAAWVLTLVVAAPTAPLSAARLAEDWGTDRSWVCRALPAIEAAGVWALERAGRLVRITLHRAPLSLSPGQRNDAAVRCPSGNEAPAVRCLPSNEQPSRCLSSNELLLLEQRNLFNSSSNNEHLRGVQPQRQRARAPRAGARPVAAAVKALVSDERRNGGGLGRPAATEPAEQETSKDARGNTHVVEALLGRVGLSGAVATRLARLLIEQATTSKRDLVELTQSGLDAATSAKNPAGWLRRAIEGGWLLERTLPGATASHTKNAGAPNQPPRMPLGVLPRVSPKLWDVDLERAVLYAIGNDPRCVAHGRTWMAVNGGVAACFARLRSLVARAPTDLAGVFLPGGVQQWRRVAPQLEEFAARAQATTSVAGVIVAHDRDETGSEICGGAS